MCSTFWKQSAGVLASRGNPATEGGGDLEQIQCVFSSECFCYLAGLFHFIRIQQRAVCKVDLD